MPQKQCNQMSSSVITNIDFFFMNPTTVPVIPGTFSQLYLLRRDILTCFGIDANDTGQTLPTKALWPGVMGICAGIDLLGKFLAGNDNKGEVGKRFKGFLITYLSVGTNDAEILYHLRNSLIHSFGLYSDVTDRAGNVVREYKFVLTTNTNILITPTQSSFVIDIEAFREKFETAIDLYEAQLRHDTNLQVQFSKHQGISIGAYTNQNEVR
ncbi:MAG: hypothetical protein JNK77_00820 [Saprospiraceae bacterium]|nr:hypothetical protein [Saprospiraceae bacterium]